MNLKVQTAVAIPFILHIVTASQSNVFASCVILNILLESIFDSNFLLKLAHVREPNHRPAFDKHIHLNGVLGAWRSDCCVEERVQVEMVAIGRVSSHNRILPFEYYRRLVIPIASKRGILQQLVPFVLIINYSSIHIIVCLISIVLTLTNSKLCWVLICINNFISAISSLWNLSLWIKANPR